MRKSVQSPPGGAPPDSGGAAEKRLARLRKMVREGTYRVQAEEVADKIVEDTLRAARFRRRSE